MSKQKERKKKKADNKKKTISIDIPDPNKHYKYQMIKKTLTPDCINQLRELNPPFGHHRKIRKGQVNKLYQMLLNGQHFETPLVLELIGCGDSGYRIIDGLHRYSAIKKLFEDENISKDSKIAFYAAVYSFNDESEDDKKRMRQELFVKWNSGTIQSTHDYIASYQSEIPMFKKIAGPNKKVPCTIYGDKNDPKFGDTLKFKDFVGGYLAGIKPGEFLGGYSGNAREFVEECLNRKNYLNQDVYSIEHAWDIITKAYELQIPYNFHTKPLTIKQNVARTTPFYALMRIILQNIEEFSDQEIITRLQRDRVRETINDLAKFGEREMCKHCYKQLILHINTGYENELKKQFFPRSSPEIIEQQLLDEKDFLKNYPKNTNQQKNILKVDEPINISEEKISTKDKSNKWKKFKGQYK